MNSAEYPEHLNPFRSRNSGLSKSFRGFTRALVRSFRGKDKEKPVIRPKPDPKYFLVEQRQYHEPPVPFPRSRFSERVNKTDTLREITNSRQSLPNVIGRNPFEDNEQKKNEDGALQPPKPIKRTKLKRKKKRAPIPPDSMTCDGYLSPSVNGSKWSLTSTESDMSSMYYSESEIDNRYNVTIDDNAEKTEEILKITREIAQFAEDTNNNNILNKETNVNEELGNENLKIESTDKKSDENYEKLKLTESSHECSEVPTIIVERPPSENLDLERNDNMPDVIKTTNELDPQIAADVNQNTLKVEENETTSNITESSHLKSEIDEENSIKPSSNIVGDKSEIDGENNIGSSVKIEEIEEVELRLINKEYEAEDRHSVKQTIEFFEYSGQTGSPTPKIRKNIFTKEKLLGSELN